MTDTQTPPAVIPTGQMKQAPIALPEWDLTLPNAVSLLQKSGMFGKSMTYEQAVAKAMIGRAMGMEPVEALRMIDVFDGNISIRSEYRAARIKRAKCDYRVTEHTDEKCSITFFDEQKNEVGQHTFTLEDARKMGLLGKDNWKKSQKVMLFWRCLSQGQRMYLPDALGTQGVYDEDELDEIRRSRAADREDTRDAAKALTAHVVQAAVATTEDGTQVNTATGEVIEGEYAEAQGAPETAPTEAVSADAAPAEEATEFTDPFATDGNGTLKM
ncbi:MAG: hypothetical protein ACYDCO_01915 [Armatimonadota bacterium]